MSEARRKCSHDRLYDPDGDLCCLDCGKCFAFERPPVKSKVYGTPGAFPGHNHGIKLPKPRRRKP